MEIVIGLIQPVLRPSQTNLMLHTWNLKKKILNKAIVLDSK